MLHGEPFKQTNTPINLSPFLLWWPWKARCFPTTEDLHCHGPISCFGRCFPRQAIPSLLSQSSAWAPSWQGQDGQGAEPLPPGAQLEAAQSWWHPGHGSQVAIGSTYISVTAHSHPSEQNSVFLRLPTEFSKPKVAPCKGLAVQVNPVWIGPVTSLFPQEFPTRLSLHVTSQGGLA